MRKLSLIVMFCHLLSCPAFAQSPSKGYKAGLSAVIYPLCPAVKVFHMRQPVAGYRTGRLSYSVSIE